MKTLLATILLSLTAQAETIVFKADNGSSQTVDSANIVLSKESQVPEPNSLWNRTITFHPGQPGRKVLEIHGNGMISWYPEKDREVKVEDQRMLGAALFDVLMQLSAHGCAPRWNEVEKRMKEK